MIVSKYITLSKSRCNPCPQGVYDLVRETDTNLIIIEVLWEYGTGRHDLVLTVREHYPKQSSNWVASQISR